MAAPLFSIITVVKNNVSTIKETIESVLNQSCNDFEYLIFDAASDDGTSEVINQYKNDIAYYERKPDNGIYQAMNKGIRKANGQIISFLNADDLYFKNTLETIKDYLKQSADIYYGNLTKFKDFKDGRWYMDVKPDLKKIEQNMPVFHPSMFVDKKAFEKIGFFDENFKLSADYEWVYRAYVKGLKFEYIPHNLALFRTGGLSDWNCNSFKEGIAILKKYNSPFVKDMEKNYIDCLQSRATKKNIHLLSKFPVTGNWIDKKLKKSWVQNGYQRLKDE